MKNATQITLTLSQGKIDGGFEEIITVATLDGTKVGEFVRATRVSARGTGSYYDRHRLAKGDAVVYDDGTLEWYGPDGLPTAILDAVLGDRVVGVRGAKWREAREHDQWGLWNAMKEQCRGFAHYVPKRPKTLRDREISAANKARQEAVYTIAM